MPDLRVQRRRRRARRAAKWTVGAAVVLAGAAVLYLTRDHTSFFLERRGRLVAATLQESETSQGFVRDAVSLRSSSGLEVELAVKRPDSENDRPRPVVLVAGGARTGRDAVDVVSDSEGVVLAAISYPYDGDPGVKDFELVSRIPAIRAALLDTPPALMLALDFLLDQPYSDPDRVELVGVSLGVPFVCVAGALDERVDRVWAVHGGARPAGMIGKGLEERIPFTPARVAIAELVALLVWPLAPERNVAGIAPREFVQINALDDERIPRESAELLHELAGEPKELVWTPGQHVGPRREEVVADLVEIVLERIRGEGGAATADGPEGR